VAAGGGFCAGLARFRNIVLNTTDHAPRAWPLVRVQWLMLFFLHGAPIAALGDLVRIGLIRLFLGLNLIESIQAALYDRLIGALSLVALAFLATLFQFWAHVPPAVINTQLVFCAFILVGFAAFTLMGRVPIPDSRPRVQKIAAIVRDFTPLLGRKRFIAAQLVYALLYVGSSAAVLWCLAQGMGVRVDFAVIAMFMPGIMLVSSLPVFYVGWGGREAAVLATLGVFGGVPASQAVALSVAFGVVYFLVALPGGLIWLLQPLPPSRFVEAASRTAGAAPPAGQSP
jgi:glycosyltransferase 2 family protein